MQITVKYKVKISSIDDSFFFLSEMITTIEVLILETKCLVFDLNNQSSERYRYEVIDRNYRYFDYRYKAALHRCFIDEKPLSINVLSI